LFASVGKDVAESTSTPQRCQPTQQQAHGVKVGDGSIKARVLGDNVAKPSLTDEAQRNSAPVKKLSALKHFDSSPVAGIQSTQLCQQRHPLVQYLCCVFVGTCLYQVVLVHCHCHAVNLSFDA